MQRLGLAAGFVVLTAVGFGPAAANPFSAAFVETFRETCVPERLSYERSLANAGKLGWAKFDPASNAEFDSVMEKSATALAEEKADGLEIEFVHAAFMRLVEGRELHLIVSFAESDVLDQISCYVYDFSASEPIDPSAVSAMLGLAEPAQSMETAEIASHVWGPPPSMPRTLDTYLTFIPPGSRHVADTGFDGVVLKFSTSAPDEAGQ